MRSVILAVVAGSAFSACSTPELSPQERNVQATIVEERIEQMTRYLNNRSLDSLFTMFGESPGVSLVWWDGTRAVGGQAIEDAISAQFNRVQFQSFGPQNPQVQILSDNAAVATFGFSMDIVRNDTSRDPFAGRGVIIWTRNADGPWTIHTKQLSRNPA